MKKRLLIGTAIALAVFMVGALLTATAYLENRVTLENRSGQVLNRATVEVCGRSYVFEGLEPGEARTEVFVADHDDGFDVRVLLADGRSAEGQFGYVTNGLYAERVRIVIAPDGTLQFEQP